MARKALPTTVKNSARAGKLSEPQEEEKYKAKIELKIGREYTFSDQGPDHPLSNKTYKKSEPVFTSDEDEIITCLNNGHFKVYLTKEAQKEFFGDDEAADEDQQPAA